MWINLKVLLQNKKNVALENVSLLLDGLSNLQFARMSRCLAIQMQSGAGQQHIPQDQVWVDSIPNRKSVLHYCQLCNMFPLFSF